MFASDPSDTRIILRGYIVVDEEDLQAVMDALPQHIALTRAEAGCLAFNVKQDKANPLKFFVDETFTDQAAFEHHQTRTQASAWAQISKNAQRHYEVTSTPLND